MPFVVSCQLTYLVCRSFPELCHPPPLSNAQALGCSDGKHFIILLRSHCQYGGLYSFSAADEVGVRISGLGPKRIETSLVERFYKYDSGSKRFAEITSTSHLSTVVDAVMLKGKTRNRFPSASPNI
ncbi:hypothetical protein X801_06417 [Opisthorchis viverrini]|uniref:CKK domain-containing protein n=1 Tax=Opisthorchis viverrini TaxID=6198 RepID=A0A1S8WU42_OPIVI|nr:hypothetical protein X801_06417 [Opisthorchis viverrini]